MTEEKQTPSLHPWQMSTGQLDDNQPSNKPVRALAFGLPRTTLLMGLMFVAGIVWGIHAGRQYRPLIPERVDSTRIENVQRGLEKMNTEVSKNWAEKNNAKIEAVGLTRKFITRRSGQELDNPFRPFVPEEARALAAKTAAVAATDSTKTPVSSEEKGDLKDAPSLDAVVLQGTLVGRNSSANINGQRRRVGDNVAGWILIIIKDGEVDLEWKGNVKTLTRTWK